MRTAVYPGSFDPPTCGHLDIVKRASKLFDRVLLTVFQNPNKTSLFDTQERVLMLSEMVRDLPNVEVGSSTGLLTSYASEKEALVIVRGLRAVSDFDYEFSMALLNKKLAPEIETIFIMTNPEYLYLSSSTVRELALFGADVAGLVPPNVETRLRRRLAIVTD